MNIKFIDTFLNSITMYKLVYYGLIALCGVAFLFALFGLLPFTFLQLGITLGIILGVGYVAKWVMDKIFKPISNIESGLITSLILFFILAPVASLSDVYITIAASAIAVCSKFLLAVEKKHFFNPAAFSVFLLGMLGFGNGIWWVGSSILLPFVLVLGLLIVRKIRRFHMFFVFILTACITLILFNLRNGVMPQVSITQIFLSFPLIFLGTIMLTEPLTSPHRKNLSLIYGVIVGVLFGSQFHVGPLFSSPEFSLIVGNIFAFIVSPKYKLFLQVKEKIQLAPQVQEFVFEKAKAFSFLPGQYLEWTVPGTKADTRGNRRYFTIASSPTEETLKIGIKMAGEKSSSFKKMLQDMLEGTLVASELSGDFVLPEDKGQKLVFIAGGIGITPFRSMIRYLIDTQEKRDIVLFYACATEEEFVYKDIFKSAKDILGIKVIYIISHKTKLSKTFQGESGYLTSELIKKYVPDYIDRKFYLSGPNAMVVAYKKLLRVLGIKGSAIVTDYFPGF